MYNFQFIENFTKFNFDNDYFFPPKKSKVRESLKENEKNIKKIVSNRN